MDDVSIAFRGTSAYRTKLQRAALDRGIKVQDLIERAVASYLEGGADSTQPSGYQLIAVRREAVPVVTALLDWIENDGKEKVLAAFESGLTSSERESQVSSEHERQPAVSKKPGKLQPIKP